MVTFPNGPRLTVESNGSVGKGIGVFIKGLLGMVLIAVGAFVALVAGVAFLYGGIMLGLQWGQRIAMAWGMD